MSTGREYAKWGWIVILTLTVIAVAVLLYPVFDTVIAELQRLIDILNTL